MSNQESAAEVLRRIGADRGSSRRRWVVLGPGRGPGAGDSSPGRWTADGGQAVKVAPAAAARNALSFWPPPPPALLEFRQVSKVYGSGPAAMRALDGVDLAIREGEFVAVLGPSGAGKSTAMNILGCLDTPTAGSYLFRGVEVETLTGTERARLRRAYLSFVFQGFNLLSRTSVLENVELPLIYRHSPRAERHARARAALALVGLTGWEGYTPDELSGDQQQRVAIARAIVTEPSLLLADEPTGNLDTATSHEIMELLTRLNRDRGITVLMVTHAPDMAAYAGRVIQVRDGRVTDHGRVGGHTDVR